MCPQQTCIERIGQIIDIVCQSGNPATSTYKAFYNTMLLIIASNCFLTAERIHVVVDKSIFRASSAVLLAVQKARCAALFWL